MIRTYSNPESNTVLMASDGEDTLGSPCKLKDVFNKPDIPVFSLYLEIKS